MDAVLGQFREDWIFLTVQIKRPTTPICSSFNGYNVFWTNIWGNALGMLFRVKTFLNST